MRAVRAAAWLILVPVILELCAREVARRSLAEMLLGVRPSLAALALAAIAAASAGVLARAGSSKRGVAFLFASLFATGVAAQIHLGARLQSDGFYYFAYLRSLAFDGDVEFTNDYKLIGLGDKAHLFNPTPTGYAQSAWTIGPAFVWAPFFAAAHPIARQLQAGGADVSTNGNSYPYRQAVCIAGLFYALLGCWFTFRLARLFFPGRLAAGAAALTICGSFMLWYIVKEPSMTHAPSMAGVAGFTWMWAATHGRRTRWQWALLGLIAGFITLLRWQNALFAILPAYEAFGMLLAAARRGDRPAVVATVTAGALFTACAVIGFVPQMLAWKAIYGSFLAVSPVGPQIRWWDPQIIDILWSARNGLFSWSPILYLGAIGLVLFAFARPWIGVPMLAAIAIMTYFNASVQDWWGSAGYGGRRFEGTLPLFALGVAALLAAVAAVVRRHPLRTVAAGGALLIVWNLTLMSAAQDGHVRIGEAVSFGEAGAHQARAFHRWFGNPFTYPVSLVFALRNGLPIGSYDLLSSHRFLGDELRPYGRIDIGVADEIWLEDGWHAAEEGGGINFRWTASPATLLIALDHAAPLRVQVRMQAFNYPGAEPQMMTPVVNGRRLPAVAVPPEWTTVVFEVDETAWRAGVNRLLMEFSRANRPVDVGLGGDNRLLAAGIDYVRVEVAK